MPNSNLKNRLLLFTFLTFGFLTFGQKSELTQLIEQEGFYAKENLQIENILVRNKIYNTYIDSLPNNQKSKWVVKLGESYNYLNEFYLSIRYLKEATNYEDANKVYIYSLIGDSYKKLNELDSSIFYFKKALIYSTQIDIVKSKNSIGFLYKLKGDYFNANNWFQEALADFSNSYSLDSIQYFNIISNKASIKYELKEYKSSLALLHKIHSSANFKKLPIYFQSEILLKIIKNKIELGECIESNSELNLLEKFTGSNNPILIKSKIQYSSICPIKETKENLYSKLIAYNDSIHIVEKRTARVIEKLQFERILQEDKLNRSNLNLQVEIKNSQIDAKNLWILIISIVFFSFLIIIILYLRRQHSLRIVKQKKLQIIEAEKLMQKSQYEKDQLNLELKNQKLKKERHGLLTELTKQNLNLEILTHVQLKINEISPEDQKSKSKLKSLNYFLNNQLNKLKIQNTFIQNEFIKDSSFKQRIQDKFENLTNAEIQLVVLLKLEMSNKEIAEIKNIENSSLRVLKNRLKNKLGCAKKIKLEDFIKSI